MLKVQSEREEQEKREKPSCKAERTQMMRGIEGVEVEMDWKRARLRALMTTGSGTMEEEWLSEEVLMSSFHERALVGSI